MDQPPFTPFNYTPFGKKPSAPPVGGAAQAQAPVLPPPSTHLNRPSPSGTSVMGENQFIFPTIDGDALGRSPTQLSTPSSSTQGQKRLFLYKSQASSVSPSVLHNARNGISSSHSTMPSIPASNRISASSTSSSRPPLQSVPNTLAFQKPDGPTSPSRPTAPKIGVPAPPQSRPRVPAVPPAPAPVSFPPPSSHVAEPPKTNPYVPQDQASKDVNVTNKESNARKDDQPSLFLDSEVDDDLFLNIPDIPDPHLITHESRHTEPPPPKSVPLPPPEPRTEEPSRPAPQKPIALTRRVPVPSVATPVPPAPTPAPAAQVVATVPASMFHQLEAARSAEHAEMQAKINELKQQQAELQQIAQSKAGEASTLRDLLFAKEQEVSQVKKQLMNAENSSRAKFDQLNNSGGMSLEETRELPQIKTQLQFAKQDIAQLEARLQKMNQELEDRREVQAQAEAQIQKQAQANALMHKQIEEYRSQVSVLQHNLMTTASSLAALSSAPSSSSSFSASARVSRSGSDNFPKSPSFSSPPTPSSQSIDPVLPILQPSVVETHVCLLFLFLFCFNELTMTPFSFL